MATQGTLKIAIKGEPDSESLALLYLSQQATRPQVRRWLAEADGARAAYVRHGEAPDWPREALAVTGIRVATLFDDAYPEPLRHIPDPPLALYYQGNLAVAQGPGIALVGARRGTRLGLRIAESMGRELATQGARILSGLALGVDGAAHQGALASGVDGCAWAVLGSGLNNIYPREHRALARRILDAGGAVISEYPPDARPYRGHFPERNRLISGLAEAVVVVEASRRSGSLITARMAAEQGREVFAVPGAVGNAVSAGCHWLIRQGAGLVESAEDVLMELGYGVQRSDSPTPPPQALMPVLAAVSATASPIDEIALAAGLPVEAVTGDLVQLELKGFVQLTPDGYIRVPR
ncbi:MAG: DNA-processing protein DprA [Gammaproteobacteria bacterium]|nr:DNA-processing protein DprA [Gammaproteobacteria bacterium]MDE0271559.1 DNA-processing protein DprA [Gammaproteobacteria bacterium]